MILGDFLCILFSTLLLYFLLDVNVINGSCDLRLILGFDSSNVLNCREDLATTSSSTFGSAVGLGIRYFTIDEMNGMSFFSKYNISQAMAQTMLNILLLLLCILFLVICIVFLQPRSSLFQTFNLCAMDTQVSNVVLWSLAISVVLFLVLLVGLGFSIHSWSKDRFELDRLIKYLGLEHNYKTKESRRFSKIHPDEPLQEAAVNLPHAFVNGVLWIYPEWNSRPSQKRLEEQFHQSSHAII